MSELSALITVIVISLVLSSGTVFAIYRPLHQAARGRLPARLYGGVLDARCGDGDLPVAAVGGARVRPAELSDLDFVTAGEIARRALAATSFALVGIVIATGLRLSSLRAPSRYDYPPPVR